jgi:hypothetical protein
MNDVCTALVGIEKRKAITEVYRYREGEKTRSCVWARWRLRAMPGDIRILRVTAHHRHRQHEVGDYPAVGAVMGVGSHVSDQDAEVAETD